MIKINNPLAKKQLRTMSMWIISLFFAALLLTQIVFISAMGKGLHAARIDGLRQQTIQLQAQSDAVIDIIARNANTLAYGSSAQKFSVAENQFEVLSAYSQMGIMMDAIAVANPHINQVFYTDFDLVSVGNLRLEMFDIQRRLKDHFNRTQWPEEQQYLSLYNGDSQILVCVTPSFLRNGKRMYTVVNYALDLRTIAPLENPPEDVHIYLVNSDGVSLHQRASLREGEAERLMQRVVQLDDGINNIDVAEYFAVASAKNRMVHTRWLCVIRKPFLMIELENMVRFVIMMDVVVVILMVLFYRTLESGITRPLSSIIAFVDRAGNQGGMGRLEVKNYNEIGQIAEQINRLLDTVESIDKEKRRAQKSIYQLELSQKQTELNALYSQINPHFLYNTLDCIRSIAMVNDVPQIEEIANSMSDILRYSIKGKAFVRLREEMERIREYIGIMQIRYQNRFLIRIDIEEVLLDAFIPRMILQPIVENAIFHGLEASRRLPKLIISAEVISLDHMCLRIQDNGQGIREEILARLKESISASISFLGDTVGERRSIGLLNIAHRIRLIFGPRYGLEIESTLHEGTCVKITIPIIVTSPESTSEHA